MNIGVLLSNNQNYERIDDTKVCKYYR